MGIFLTRAAKVPQAVLWFASTLLTSITARRTQMYAKAKNKKSFSQSLRTAVIASILVNIAITSFAVVPSTHAAGAAGDEVYTFADQTGNSVTVSGGRIAGSSILQIQQPSNCTKKEGCPGNRFKWVGQPRWKENGACVFDMTLYPPSAYGTLDGNTQMTGASVHMSLKDAGTQTGCDTSKFPDIDLSGIVILAAKKAGSQADCTPTGTVYDSARGGCEPPSNQDACSAAIPGSTFKQGDNTSPNICVAASSTCDNKDSNGNCTASDDTIDCGGGAFNWLVCPVISLTAKAGQVLDNFITSTLDVDVKYIFDGTDQKGTAPYGYYTAWNSFRVIADVVLVIAGLVMVASQALGFEILDAYTIRRTLPRLMVAIIGISLSWPLMRFAVQLFDTIGFDVRGLIYGPFQHFNAHYSLSASILTDIGAVGAILLLGPASLTIILSLLITIFIGFVALVIRQVALILLIILAPVAIACYVLPNTQRGWKLWHENFFGLLLAFPLISGAIAAGHVFAVVAISTGTTSTGSLTADAAGLITHFTMHGFTQTLADTANNVGGITTQAIALGADNAPKLAVGTLMKATVGAVSTFAGNAAGFLGTTAMSKGLSGIRGNAMRGRFGKMQNQSLWDNNSRIGRGMNRAASWITDPVNNVAYAGRDIPGLRKRGQKVAGHIEHARAEQSGKLFEELNKAGYNDRAFRALSGAHGQIGVEGGFSEKVKEELDKAKLLGKSPQSLGELQTMADILRTHGNGSTDALAANAIHGSMGRLATLYQDPEMAKASTAAAGVMGLSAHGFASGEDLAAVGNSLQGKDGHDAAFAQSVVTQAQLMGARSRPDVKAGYGVMYKKDEAGHARFINGMSSEGDRDLSLLSSLNGHDVAGAKGGFLADTNVQHAYEQVLQKSQQDPSYREAAEKFNKASTKERSDMSADEKRKATAYNIHGAVKDQLFSWAGPYSQASADIKAGAIQMIERYGLGEQFKGYSSRERSPETRGEGGPPPADPGAGPGGPGS
jgi:hypothetical protein